MDTNRVLPLTESMKLSMLNYIDKPVDTMRTLALATIEQTKKTLANPDDWLITVKMEQGVHDEIVSSVELTPLLVTQTFTIDNGK